MILSTPPLWLGSVLVVGAYGVAASRPAQGRWWLSAAWAAQAVLLLAELLGLGLPEGGARFGFASALSLTLWLVVGVALLESRFKPWPAALRGLALTALVTVGLAQMFPGASLATGHTWAPLHMALGVAAYGLVGAAVLHAWLMQRVERDLRHPSPSGFLAGWPLLRLERLTFQFLSAGVGVLSSTLLLGWWLTPQWHWDHKTVFAVLAWLVLATLLGARRVLGWRGSQAVRWLYAGAALLLLSYVGSRFVMQVLLGRSV